MSEETKHSWGVSGILIPFVIRDAKGKVVDTGAFKMNFKHGIAPEKLPSFAEKNGNFAKLAEVIKEHALNEFGSGASDGFTCELISIEEYKTLSREFDDDDDDADTSIDADSSAGEEG